MAFWELVFELIGELAWPLVVVLIILLFRSNFMNLIDRIREVKGPGDIGIRIDPSKVEELVEGGRKETLLEEGEETHIQKKEYYDEHRLLINGVLSAQREITVLQGMVEWILTNNTAFGKDLNSQEMDAIREKATARRDQLEQQLKELLGEI